MMPDVQNGEDEGKDPFYRLDNIPAYTYPLLGMKPVPGFVRRDFL